MLFSDTWLAHGLDAAAIDSLVEKLRNIPGLSRAYLVRKRVTHRPEVPLYVIGFATMTLGLPNKSRAQTVMEQLRITSGFPGETLIINVQGANEHFGRAFSAVQGAQII